MITYKKVTKPKPTLVNSNKNFLDLMYLNLDTSIRLNNNCDMQRTGWAAF
jgi:hypothetical protein